MAHLWTTSDAGDWEPVELSGDLFVLGPEGQPMACPLLGADTAADVVAVRRLTVSPVESWLLLLGGDAFVHVNGVPIDQGIVALADRDEIRLGRARPIYFSTERMACVEVLPVDTPRGFCPRCKQPLQPGELAVRCPGCGLWSHETATLPCWSYAPHCAACAQLTALEPGYQWTPEGL